MLVDAPPAADALLARKAQAPFAVDRAVAKPVPDAPAAHDHRAGSRG